MKFFSSFDGDLEPSEKGKMFVSPSGSEIMNMSSVHVLGSYIDTVRQLYEGAIDDSFLESFLESKEDNRKHFYYLDHKWSLGVMPKSSGFRYRLQNSELGVIILFRSWFAKSSEKKTHLKIELSPWYIDNIHFKEVQSFMDSIADLILSEWTAHKVAVHLAVDIQGWNPPENILRNIRCHARRAIKFDGIEDAEYDLNEISASYGNGETYLLGGAASTQFSLYNKTLQSRKAGKLDYMRTKWQESSRTDLDGGSLYAPDLDVWRFEFRFHQDVMVQFSSTRGTDFLIKKYSDLEDYLKRLFDYGLSSFRYMYNTRTEHPLWTLIREHSSFRIPDHLINKEFKRYKKTALGFTGKNIDLFLGNFITLASYQGIPFELFLSELQRLSIYPMVLEHFQKKGKVEKDIVSDLRGRYEERRLRGVTV